MQTTTSDITHALNLLGKTWKQQGSHIQAQCPAHEDRNPSLSVDERNGKTLVTCHAGCSYSDIMSALNLKRSDVYVDRVDDKLLRWVRSLNTNADTIDLREPDTTVGITSTPNVKRVHRYFNQAGDCVYEKRRYDETQQGRKFDWYRLDRDRKHDGHYVIGLADITQYPYRLPELLAADKSQPVVICEGERDADIAASLGAVATSVPHGAGSWKKEWTLSYLQGRDVLVIVDNDDAGIKSIPKMSNALTSPFTTVLGFAHPAHHKDLADMVEAGVDDLTQGLKFLTFQPDTEELLPLGVGVQSDTPFDLEVFPPWLAAMVAELATDVQVPQSFPALLALGSIAATAVGRVQFECGWTEEAGLYLAAALPSGSGKSPVFRKMMGWLYDFEDELAQGVAGQRLRAETERNVVGSRLKRLEDQASKTQNREEVRKLVAEIIEERAYLEGIKIPPIPRLWADDVTPEKMAVIMADTGGPLTIMTPEGGPFRMMGGGYGEIPNLDVWLKAYTGEAIAVDRIKRESIKVSRPVLNMVLAVQPQVLAALRAKPELTDRGLVPRFLFAMPESNIGGRDRRAKRVTRATVETYESRMMDLARTIREATTPTNAGEQGNLRQGSGEIRPLLLTATPDAQEVFDSWCEGLEPRRKADQDLCEVVEWSVKLESSTVRIAGLLALAWNVDATTIEAHDMERAVSLAEFFISQVKRVYGVWSETPGTEDAKLILDWIRETGTKEFLRRDVMRRYRTKFIRTDDTNEGISILVERGYLRPEPRQAFDEGKWYWYDGFGGGRQSVRFVVADNIEE